MIAPYREKSAKAVRTGVLVSSPLFNYSDCCSNYPPQKEAYLSQCATSRNFVSCSTLAQCFQIISGAHQCFGCCLSQAQYSLRLVAAGKSFRATGKVRNCTLSQKSGQIYWFCFPGGGSAGRSTKLRLENGLFITPSSNRLIF